MLGGVFANTFNALEFLAALLTSIFINGQERSPAETSGWRYTGMTTSCRR